MAKKSFSNDEKVGRISSMRDFLPKDARQKLDAKEERRRKKAEQKQKKINARKAEQGNFAPEIGGMEDQIFKDK